MDNFDYRILKVQHLLSLVLLYPSSFFLFAHTMSLNMNDDRLHDLRQSIDECGYGILPGYIDAQMVSVLVDKINAQAKVVIEAYGLDASDDSCKALLALGKHLHKSPPGWLDPMRAVWRLPF